MWLIHIEQKQILIVDDENKKKQYLQLNSFVENIDFEELEHDELFPWLMEVYQEDEEVF